jgi:hypothetical protein
MALSSDLRFKPNVLSAPRGRILIQSRCRSLEEQERSRYRDRSCQGTKSQKIVARRGKIAVLVAGVRYIAKPTISRRLHANRHRLLTLERHEGTPRHRT